MNSGYQMTLNYVKMNPEEKTEIREVYYKIIEKIDQ